MTEQTAFRAMLLALLALLVLIFAARVAFSIYEWGHKDQISVWCDDDLSDDGHFERSYRGPADKVINACVVRR